MCSTVGGGADAARWSRARQRRTLMLLCFNSDSPSASSPRAEPNSVSSAVLVLSSAATRARVVVMSEKSCMRGAARARARVGGVCVSVCARAHAARITRRPRTSTRALNSASKAAASRCTVDARAEISRAARSRDSAAAAASAAVASSRRWPSATSRSCTHTHTHTPPEVQSSTLTACAWRGLGELCLVATLAAHESSA